MLENTTQLGLMSYTERGLVKKRECPFNQFNTVTTPTFDHAGRTISLEHDLQATAGNMTFSYDYIPSGQLSHISRTNETYAWDGHVDRAHS
ncbi:hypothetical protein QWY75_13445 [Pontixanthobacter aestiaquae]|uniref:YD repeat-containing protein n=1 Tax=Pontixanthobacter aestiaquae TaxID=1509367 RepID=A0A844Z2V0_9SPHN|nr:hypothetical protein [Pontixanthobacter aestiaquae]MDN3647211.1 hypothetical protein [Pontixanthobacter aestiaquae]MXO81814.1 hypothetical protein [Pontixanthobacter aestiaquae]